LIDFSSNGSAKIHRYPFHHQILQTQFMEQLVCAELDLDLREGHPA
jgi:hypothetical protein